MFRNLTTSFLFFALCLIACRSSLAQNSPTSTPTGRTITNQASASYRDPSGSDIQTYSNPISLTITSVINVSVGPDDTQPTGVMIPNEKVTRLFSVCNTGNTADTYHLTQATITPPATISALYWDVDNSGTLTPADTPITLNTTLSPTVQPDNCLNVLVLVDSGALKLDEVVTIGITVRSHTDPNKTDPGTILNQGGEPTKVSDPGNPSLPPVKYVENKDHVTSTAGAILNYSINFRNSGVTPALNVLLSDDLPSELDYVPGTLKLGTTPLSDAIDGDAGHIINGRRIEVKLASVAVNEVVSATFQAKLNSNTKPGVGVINTAQVAGDNIGTAVRTAKTTVVINPEGTVYAGYSGGAVRIAGAKVVVATDQEGKTLLPLPTGGFAPNEKNENPFLSDAQGHFAFAFSPNQIGAPGAPVTYYLHVTAPGYR
ncbi:MAG TPA: isopeptide-forming domain-containing fimbrial protein, partial [Blastocatellia bacterium]|nr:isopeptide-forming domain-containing fimbrial protein [Blastocatellia bacterium]